jgi:deferrochelatase/peroxidase EfeB
VGRDGDAGLAEVCPGIETWDRGSLDDREQIVRPHLDPGSFFLAYRRDPRTAFVPIQLFLARNDAMMEYLRHTGSAIWACPPGVRADGWWGDTLFPTA